MSNGTPIANPGWQDIKGIFATFTSYMMWRFDLGDYDDVCANAQIILLRLTDPNAGTMPPPGFPPLAAYQVQTFQNWVNQNCPYTPLADSAPAAEAAAPAPAAAPSPSTDRGGFRFT